MRRRFEEIDKMLNTDEANELENNHPEVFEGTTWAQVTLAIRKETPGTGGLVRPVVVSHDYFLAWIPEDGVKLKKGNIGMIAPVVKWYDHETETFHTSSAYYSMWHVHGWLESAELHSW